MGMFEKHGNVVHVKASWAWGRDVGEVARAMFHKALEGEIVIASFNEVSITMEVED